METRAEYIFTFFYNADVIMFGCHGDIIGKQHFLITWKVKLQVKDQIFARLITKLCMWIVNYNFGSVTFIHLKSEWQIYTFSSFLFLPSSSSGCITIVIFCLFRYSFNFGEYCLPWGRQYCWGMGQLRYDKFILLHL